MNSFCIPTPCCGDRRNLLGQPKLSTTITRPCRAHSEMNKARKDREEGKEGGKQKRKVKKGDGWEGGRGVKGFYLPTCRVCLEQLKTEPYGAVQPYHTQCKAWG